VVGLSKESTTDSGNGPAFAVGDTLAGSTDEIAAPPHPKVVDVPAPAPAPVRAPGRNRVASGGGVAGSVLTPPRRIHEVKPNYPDALRAKGVEADVVLVASIDASGKVIAVTVAKTSGDLSFDEAARAAALQERFSPALRDGTPVPTTIPFTTHFRLDLP
jgi:TonB family protein